MTTQRRATPAPRPAGPAFDEPRRALRWAALLLALGTVLCLLMWSMATRRIIQHVDDGFLHLTQRLRWGPAVDVAKVLAFLGGAVVTWCVRAAVLVILAWRRHWLSVVAFALAIVTSEALIGPLKALYQRPRPPDPLVSTSGWSFPSGHAVAAAVTAVGLVIVLVPPGRDRWRWERWAVLYASLMALSRTYLGVHWLSDVVAGALLGGGLAIAWPALLVGRRERRSAPPPAEAEG